MTDFNDALLFSLSILLFSKRLRSSDRLNAYLLLCCMVFHCLLLCYGRANWSMRYCAAATDICYSIGI
jgi:hypothetical protein